MAFKTVRYGWQPDLPDQRDFQYSAPKAFISTLPKKVDLRKQCPAAYDQGQLGSCTANAIGGAFEFELLKQNAATAFTPSRLFIYYNERVIEHSVKSDSGAQLRDGIKTVNMQGACHETIWPYIITKYAQKPVASAYSDALKYQAVTYQAIARAADQMKACLSQGYPFVFGFTVYESFESEAVAKSGKVNLPKQSEAVVGGHAVMAVGYNDASKRFILRNSWGAGWGMAGYFTMPYEYLLDQNLSSDFWTIRLITDDPNAKKK